GPVAARALRLLPLGPRRHPPRPLPGRRLRGPRRPGRVGRRPRGRAADAGPDVQGAPAGDGPGGARGARREDPRRRRLRLRRGRVQLGRPARPQEPHRPLSRGVVLAAGGGRQLLGRPDRRGAGQPRLARHPVRDGHGRGLEHADGRANQRGPRRGGDADGRGGRGDQPRVPALRRGPRVVGGGGAPTARAPGAALL
ncbi:MAG: NADPH-dependent FMN reductase, partial [uncultured Gemmatimonadaceae bacterium]